jgi:RNA polymerase sigma-70 factor (ECF subfamily)
MERDLSAERAQCERARNGDGDALGTLLSAHGPRLYRNVLLPRLGTVPAAEEALAATYLEVVKSFPSFEWQGVGVYPWLRQVALRVALKAVRKSGLETLCDPADIASEIERGQQAPESIEEAQERARAREYVERALERLSPGHAEALRLRFLEERSREELGQRWQITANAVDQRIHRAKEALRKVLRATGASGQASPLMFLLVDGGAGNKVFVFNRNEITIGRDPSSDLVLPGEGVSREHARLTIEGSRYTLEDLGSSNGTRIGKRPLEGAVRVAMRDTIDVGGYRITIATTPLLSLWARTLLTERPDEPDPDERSRGARASGLPPTSPLAEILRAGAQAGAAKCSTEREERIESLLRTAWGLEGLAPEDDKFSRRAAEAAVLTIE